MGDGSASYAISVCEDGELALVFSHKDGKPEGL